MLTWIAEEMEKVVVEAATEARRASEALDEKNLLELGEDSEDASYEGALCDGKMWNGYPPLLNFLEGLRDAKAGGGDKDSDDDLPARYETGYSCGAWDYNGLPPPL